MAEISAHDLDGTREENVLDDHAADRSPSVIKNESRRESSPVPPPPAQTNEDTRGTSRKQGNATGSGRGRKPRPLSAKIAAPTTGKRSTKRQRGFKGRVKSPAASSRVAKRDRSGPGQSFSAPELQAATTPHQLSSARSADDPDSQTSSAPERSAANVDVFNAIMQAETRLEEAQATNHSLQTQCRTLSQRCSQLEGDERMCDELRRLRTRTTA